MPVRKRKRERETPSEERAPKGPQCRFVDCEKIFNLLKNNPPATTSSLLAKLFALALEDSRFRTVKENRGRILFGAFLNLLERFKKEGLRIEDDIKGFLDREGIREFTGLFREVQEIGRQKIHGFSRRFLLETLKAFLQEYSQMHGMKVNFRLFQKDKKRWELAISGVSSLREQKHMEELPEKSPAIFSGQEELQDRTDLTGPGKDSGETPVVEDIKPIKRIEQTSHEKKHTRKKKHTERQNEQTSFRQEMVIDEKPNYLQGIARSNQEFLTFLDFLERMPPAPLLSPAYILSP